MTGRDAPVTAVAESATPAPRPAEQSTADVPAGSARTAQVAAPARRAPWVGAEPPVGQVVAIAAAVTLGAGLVEILVADAIGLLFSAALIVVSVGAALTVRPRNLFTAGVLPPLLLVGVLIALAVLQPHGIQVARMGASAGVAQRVIAGFVHLAGALVLAHATALLVVALRGRTERLRRRRQRQRPLAADDQ